MKLQDQTIFQDVIRSILRDNLEIRETETYLFFTDFNSRFEEHLEDLAERRRFLQAFYEAFFGLRKEFPNFRHEQYQSTARHGAEPGEILWKAALGKRVYEQLVKKDLIWKLIGEFELSEGEQGCLAELMTSYADDIVDCVVAFPWYSVTHTRFRKLLTDFGCRFVSMPMLTSTVMSGPLRADWNEVAVTTQKVYQILLDSSSLLLKCPAGTDLRVGIGDASQIHEDNGKFTEKGCIGNLPAGEAYLVPRAETAQGTLVFTSGPEFPEIEATPAIIENGELSDFTKETKYSKILDKKFERDFHVRHIAEVGIGTNPLAKDVSSMIEGEKIRGTVHVALGDDSSIGGRTEATEHLDHIIVNPTLTMQLNDGKEVTLIDRGRLLV
ncbi:MAG: aminopeptidase [bacterium]|nr:aminopeptidase [bacterium]